MIREYEVYGVVCEAPGQDPILMECEGFASTVDHARAAARRMNATRYCIVRLVPVNGNELLLQDMERLQRPYQKQETPF